MADSIETEWQFDAPDLERVRAWLVAQPSHAPLTFEPVRDREQVDSYFDTADWRLFHAGFSLRRRQTGDEYELTLKALEMASDGPLARREISESSGDGEITAGAGPVSDRIRLIVGRRSLQRLFDVRTRRRTFAVRGAGEQVAVAELDETTVAPTTGQPSTFRRVEVEMAGAAEVADVEPFVQAMVESCALVATTASKYEMGLRASALTPDSTLDFGSTARDADADVAMHAYAWLRLQWSAFLRHEPGTRLGEDIEALHQMRVATRRLRAGIRVFAPVLPPALLRLRDELQWVGHELGAVRDFDVQVEELEARRAVASWDDSSALAPLITAVQRARADERVRLIDLLNSTRYDALVDEMSHLLRAGVPSDVEKAVDLYTFAAPVLDRRYRRVARRIKALHSTSEATEFHEVRIRAKQLRYSSEIFGVFYGVPGEQFVVALKTVQDHLGEHQDADVGIARLRALVSREGATLPPETLVAVGRMMEQYTQRMMALRSEAPPLLDRLRRRWRPFARHIASLADAQAVAREDEVSAPVSPEDGRSAHTPVRPPTAQPQPAPPVFPFTPGIASIFRPDDGAETLTRMRHLFQRD